MSELSQFRLLLAEDEPTQRLLLERQLKNAGYIVETASDGEEALKKIINGQFQILITDWDMPGMDGATLCRRVREANLPTYLYVLLLTSHATTADVVTGLEAGADDYVRKPPVPAELMARLTAGKRIVQLEQSLREANARIQLMSVTDSMLNIFNRRYLNEQIVREVERARRYNHPLSAVMTDLDRFKRINDERGHAAGDEVLVRFAELAKSAIRQCDWMARFGGEEFVIVLPETTLAGAVATAEKIRALCCAEPFSTSNGQLMVTASFGVAELHAPQSPADAAAAALLREADAALYTSKHEGRNRVTSAVDETSR
jgi:two-component system cell cycle response regulator